jgi:hypothetical protein
MPPKTSSINYLTNIEHIHPLSKERKQKEPSIMQSTLRNNEYNKDINKHGSAAPENEKGYFYI